MVVIDRWSLYRKTVNNDHLIKWWLCTGFLKKVSASNLTRKLPWTKSIFYKVRISWKQLNEVSRSGEALHKVRRICQQLYEVRTIRQQLYKVRVARQ